MTQAVIAYVLTVAAAAWVVWAVLLPKSAKRALKGRRKPAVAGGAKGGCGDGCGCSD
jgi:hypothetical protein